MDNLNKRITIVQHFLQLLRLIKKGKINNNITNQMVYALRDLSAYYPKESIDEVFYTNREI